MITHHDGVFHIRTEGFSYLLRVTQAGLPEQLHFGAPVSEKDAAALACKPGIGWGCSVVYTDKKTCLDTLPLEWSGSGRGDYRESPIALAFADGSRATDFTYRSYRIFDGSEDMACGLPQAQGALQTLELTLAHPGGVELKLYYTLFETAIARRAVLVNESGEPVQLSKLMSFCLDIPGRYEMLTFGGSWIGEMRPCRTAVGSARVVHESTTGFSSNRHQPGFLLYEPDAGQDHGNVYGFNLIYSGNHYASAQRSFQGLTRVMQGISPSDFEARLGPGERFETPQAVLCWSDRGFNGLSRRLHTFVNRHIVPEYWRYRQRPVLYNSWEGCMFSFTEKRLVELAKTAKKAGCELFVLDDGWFGQRNHDRAGLGDYHVNLKKLPHGLKGLADRINALGMEFGLWFEPEAVNPDSDLYRAHPDWALTDALPEVYGRNELLLDLTKGEVRDYIVESVGATLDSANITYVKWDMNRHSIALGRKAHEYILGLYEVLRRIFGPRPHILLEGCASGGNRFDLGMLCFAPQIWCSDDTDPIERLTIQESLSYLYPQSTFGAHVSEAPHAQTLRATPLATRGNVSFFGCLGYELELKHLLEVELQEIKRQIAFYKRHRYCFQFGTFTRLQVEDATAWQVSTTKKHIAGVFHTLVHAAPGYQQLRLAMLTPGKTYRLESRPQKLRIGLFGGLVKHISPIAPSPNGGVLRTVDRFFSLPDGGESMTATGGAMMAGVQLSPRFAGTGYDPHTRSQGDFSSNVYVIQEVTGNEKHT